MTLYGNRPEEVPTCSACGKSFAPMNPDADKQGTLCLRCARKEELLLYALGQLEYAIEAQYLGWEAVWGFKIPASELLFRVGLKIEADQRKAQEAVAQGVRPSERIEE